MLLRVFDIQIVNVSDNAAKFVLVLARQGDSVEVEKLSSSFLH